jgi:UDP-N-acetylglucosamine 4,6-dehydratase
MLERGASILITGGTGSFGRKCVEALLERHEPRRLVVFSRDEQKHVDMERNLFPLSRYPQLRYFVGDVRDLPRLRRALRGIEVVIHAAAMKHVPMAEYNPQECIATNVVGAQNVISACIDEGVKRVVALSTDKAASPVNLYGATKLCSDKLFVAANALAGAGGPRFAVVRYGNVVGSKGSVIPFFLKEREKGVLPLTDRRMTRFWITLGQGVDFVIRSLGVMRGGEIFVPKLPSMRMTDLAGTIGPDCRIEEIGIRPGEKLHESMITVDDAPQTLEMDDYYVIQPSFAWWGEAERNGYGDARPCPDGFAYTSDANLQWLTGDQLRAMIDELAAD